MDRLKNIRAQWAVVTAIAMLAGCGGGGGDSGAGSTVTSTSSNGTNELTNFAAAYMAFRVASSLPIMNGISTSSISNSAATIISCDAGGSATIATSPKFSAAYQSCKSSYDPTAVFNGTLNVTTGSQPNGLLMTGVTVNLSSPIAASVSMPDGPIQSPLSNYATASILSAAPTVTESAKYSSLSFKIGSQSNYVISNYTIGSTGNATRAISGGHLNATTPQSAGHVAFNGTTLTYLQKSTITWQDSGNPASGSFTLSNTGTLESISVQFLSSQQFTLQYTTVTTAGLTTTTLTKNWTDADVLAAFHAVTQ